MARKHFDEYYKKICSQFYSLQEVFDDISQEVANGMVEPERQTQLEATIKPIKESYQTLLYIKYLLDMPAKKQKQPTYKRMNKKLLKMSEGHQDKDILQKNSNILNKLKNN